MAARIEYEMWAKTKSSQASAVKSSISGFNKNNKKNNFKKLGNIASKGEAGAAMKMFDDLFGDKKW